MDLSSQHWTLLSNTLFLLYLGMMKLMTRDKVGKGNGKKRGKGKTLEKKRTGQDMCYDVMWRYLSEERDLCSYVGCAGEEYRRNCIHCSVERKRRKWRQMCTICTVTLYEV